eukprot:TRINITY_DN6602_c0_g1_i1.p1 TRINITY_DN6602_c0_g1~~TRINITY_DN6602_c0_g1_i1.p1  ORF type:complete len:172 (-),score=35.85 TRINITY_DN6602_c0_g1_i1:72-587(-)
MNSKAGKKYIRDQIGAEGMAIIDVIKTVVRLKDGDKKAKEIENVIMRTAVKIVVLFKNKDLSKEGLLAPIRMMKTLWSDVLDCCEMSFAYDPVCLSESATKLQKYFVQLLKPYVTEKNLNRMNEAINYIKSPSLLDKLYLSPECEKTKEQLGSILRKLWDKLFRGPVQKAS